MNDIITDSATALAQRIREREVSSEEVVVAYLKQIEQVNPTINAIVQLTAEAALTKARQADEALARGDVRGPLHGVPFTAKDVFDVAGVISAVGLPERASFAPDRDACVIARMRAAGAILLGKTNCPPGGGGGESDNPIYGRTSNPYDTTRTSGGSSGGEAAIIAACGSPLGLGSDSGGSIRVPAHFCGVAGLKPTSGRVPNTGTLNHPGGLSDPRTQIGSIARYVTDLGPAFAVIAGVDWRDSGVIPMPLGDPQLLTTQGLRVAYYTNDGLMTATPTTTTTVQQAAQALAEAKLIVEEARPEQIADALDITKRYWQQHELSGAQVEELFADWDGFRTHMLTFIEHYDVVLCPVSAFPAPLHGEMTVEGFSYTIPFSLCGWPCVSVRAGVSPEGLPIGVQVVARPWREDVALAVAQIIETTLGGWKPHV
jgi:amidase